MGLTAYGIFRWRGVQPFATGAPLAPALYLVLHGSYGFMWLAKDVMMPDLNWQRRATWASGLLIFGTLSTAYVLPCFCLAAAPAELSLARVGAAVGAYIAGVFLHFGADCQKFFTLKHRAERDLITEGFFSMCRNPNYLGEVLIYGSLAAMTNSHWPWVADGLMWTLIFWPNMVRKDASMSRYGAKWEAYCKEVPMFLPNAWRVLRQLPAALIPRSAPPKGD